MTAEEEWKSIEGFDEYRISSHGRVKSLKFGKERILKPRKSPDGYFSIVTCVGGKEKSHKIHRLVASAFIENSNHLPQVDHIDRNVTNNTVSNLRWVTPSENSFNTHRHYKDNYGIYWKKQFGFYQVMITHCGKLRSLGCSKDFDTAKEMRDVFLKSISTS